MTLSHSITTISAVGCALNGLAFVTFSARKELRSLFPALSAFLGVKFASDLFLNAWPHLSAPLTHHQAYLIYFITYWLSFFVSSIAILYTVRQVFDYVILPLGGLKRIGRSLFRWLCFVSAIVIFASSLHSSGFSLRAIPLSMIDLMRCVSLLELVLLAFLAYSVHPLGLSFRSHAFGVGVGLGILATTNMLTAALARFGSSIYSSLSLFSEIGTMIGFAVWCVYFLIPEPQRKSLMMPATSQLLRWNEIATAFGPRSGQVVMTPAPSTFFLQDVEKVVDRVMSRNSMDA